MLKNSYPNFHYSYGHYKRDADSLFTHLLEQRRGASPDALIDRFYDLFIDGTTYVEPDILAALHRIVASPWADKEFPMLLNRCCYILINYWWLYPEQIQNTIHLVELLTPPYGVVKSDETARRIRELLRQFTKTEQYAVLHDRARIVEKAPDLTSQLKNQPLRNLIPRYPFLYPHCLLRWDESEGGQQAVWQMQAAREREFEQDLNRYMNSLLRRPRSSHTGLSVAVDNPTLLSPQQLETTVRTFVGKAERSCSYKDLAQRFLIYNQEAKSYRDLKHQLYDYLTNAVSPDYGQHHFNYWLEKRLDQTLSNNDDVKPNDSMLAETCVKLLEYLVADPRKQEQDHLVFVDLTTNFGATFTIGLLLKILLLCRGTRSSIEAIKVYLSRRFAVLLKHYERTVKKDLEWLVECLENLMLAYSIHFGRTDFSWVNLV